MTLAQLAQFAQAASILIASLIALYGIDAWRREHVGKRNIELAEDVLASFYQARDAIGQVRSPFGYGGEGESRHASLGETPEQKAARDGAYVLVERYNKHSELFGVLRSLRYRFMASFGAEKAKPFNDLNQIVNELIMAAHTKSRLDATPPWSLRDDESTRQHQAESERIDRIFYATGLDTDPIESRLGSVVSEIESTCREVIAGQKTLFALLNAKLFST